MSNRQARLPRLRRRLGPAQAGGARAPLEFVIIAPGLLLLLALLIAGGRVTVASGAVEEAARSAARTASLQRDTGAAQAQALRVAQQSLAGQQLTCTSLDVTVDTSQYSRPLGAPAQVTATVSCAVPWSDLGLPGAPGGKTMTAEWVSVIDPYRER